ALLPRFPRPSRRAAVPHGPLDPSLRRPCSRRTRRRAPASDELSVTAPRDTLEVNTESGNERGCYCRFGGLSFTGEPSGSKKSLRRDFALTSGPVEGRNDSAGVFIH